MRKATIEDRKKYLIDTMDYFHNFCEENNIKYFLFAGTLLGAVRHKGYIPWDDDIDVAMPREDYDRFIELFDNNNPDYMVIDSRLKGYYLPYAKFSNKHTELYEYVNKPINIGINIDLFPLDHLSCSKDVALKLYKRIKKWRKLNSARLCFGKSKNLFRRIIAPLLCIIPQKLILKRIDELSRKYNAEKSEYTGAICAIIKSDEIMSESYFVERVLLNFEGRKYYAPIEYEKVLEHNFGNWRELPPVEKRVPHHLNEAYIKE